MLIKTYNQLLAKPNAFLKFFAWDSYRILKVKTDVACLEMSWSVNVNFRLVPAFYWYTGWVYKPPNPYSEVVFHCQNTTTTRTPFPLLEVAPSSAFSFKLLGWDHINMFLVQLVLQMASAKTQILTPLSPETAWPEPHRNAPDFLIHF